MTLTYRTKYAPNCASSRKATQARTRAPTLHLATGNATAHLLENNVTAAAKQGRATQAPTHGSADPIYISSVRNSAVEARKLGQKKATKKCPAQTATKAPSRYEKSQNAALKEECNRNRCLTH